MKNAVVTGAGGGIGACITELAVNLGYRVAAIDMRSDSVNELADRLDNVIPLVADITDPESVRQAFDALGCAPDPVSYTHLTLPTTPYV